MPEIKDLRFKYQPSSKSGRTHGSILIRVQRPSMNEVSKNRRWKFANIQALDQNRDYIVSGHSIYQSIAAAQTQVLARIKVYEEEIQDLQADLVCSPSFNQYFAQHAAIIGLIGSESSCLRVNNLAGAFSYRTQENEIENAIDPRIARQVRAIDSGLAAKRFRLAEETESYKELDEIKKSINTSTVHIHVSSTGRWLQAANLPEAYGQAGICSSSLVATSAPATGDVSTQSDY